MTLEQLIEMGFDASTMANFAQGVLKVGCYQCEASFINGTPCHEHGCPNQMNECAECETLIKKGYRLCESCRY